MELSKYIYMTLLMIGGTEIIFIAAIILLLFGGKKIPELMNGLGKGMRSFKDGMSGKYNDEEKDVVNDDSLKSTDEMQKNDEQKEA